MATRREVLLDGETYHLEESILFTYWSDESDEMRTALHLLPLRHASTGELVYLEGSVDMPSEAVLYVPAKENKTRDELSWQSLFSYEDASSEQPMPGAERKQYVSLHQGKIAAGMISEPLVAPFHHASYVMWVGDKLYYGVDIFFTSEYILDTKNISAKDLHRVALGRLSRQPFWYALDICLMGMVLVWGLSDVLFRTAERGLLFDSWFWWLGLGSTFLYWFVQRFPLPSTANLLSGSLALFLCTRFVQPLWGGEVGGDAFLWHMIACVALLLALFFLHFGAFLLVASASRIAMWMYLAVGGTIVQFIRPDEGETWVEAVGVLWRWPWAFLLFGAFVYALFFRYRGGWLGIPRERDDFLRTLRSLLLSLRQSHSNDSTGMFFIKINQLYRSLLDSPDPRIASLFPLWENFSELGRVFTDLSKLDIRLKSDASFREDFQVLCADLEEVERALLSEQGKLYPVRIPRALLVAFREEMHSVLLDKDGSP